MLVLVSQCLFVLWRSRAGLWQLLLRPVRPPAVPKRRSACANGFSDRQPHQHIFPCPIFKYMTAREFSKSRQVRSQTREDLNQRLPISFSNVVEKCSCSGSVPWWLSFKPRVLRTAISAPFQDLMLATSNFQPINQQGSGRRYPLTGCRAECLNLL